MIAAADRAGGEVAGASCTQLDPVHAQVSFRNPALPRPPKRTSRVPSHARLASNRALGEVTGFCCDHAPALRSQVQVSFKAPAAVAPPNNTICPLAGS